MPKIYYTRNPSEIHFSDTMIDPSDREYDEHPDGIKMRNFSLSDIRCILKRVHDLQLTYDNCLKEDKFDKYHDPDWFKLVVSEDDLPAEYHTGKLVPGVEDDAGIRRQYAHALLKHIRDLKTAIGYATTKGDHTGYRDLDIACLHSEDIYILDAEIAPVLYQVIKEPFLISNLVRGNPVLAKIGDKMVESKIICLLPSGIQCLNLKDGNVFIVGYRDLYQACRLA